MPDNALMPKKAKKPSEIDPNWRSRPRKAVARKRSLFVRLTEAELERVALAAAAEGATVSDWVRKKILAPSIDRR
jgi:hypothetical protein